VLADIEEEALTKAWIGLKDMGAQVVAAVTDVSREEDIKALAQKTLSEFGQVHLLFNNAGVGAGSLLWNSTNADWQWTMGVNLWSIIYSTNIFVPLMLNQKNECHIVNTASQAGLESGPGNGIYRVTKHAVVSFSETLYHELKMINSQISVSVLCPSFVKTRICDGDRNRPKSLKNPVEHTNSGNIQNVIDQMIRRAVENGIAPDEVAEKTLSAIKEKHFYILTHPESKLMVKQRMENIINELNPTMLVPM